jgi:hypothetical protein
MLTIMSTSDEAFIEAQRTGLTPELCVVDGPFQNVYRFCTACLQENDLDVETALVSYFGEGVFETVFEFCDMARTQSFISTTMMVTTITVLGPDSRKTVATMTVVMDLLATPTTPTTPSDSTLALAPTSSQTTPTDGPDIDPDLVTGENGMYKPRPVPGTSAAANL